MLLATVFQLGAMVGGVGQALNLAFPQVSAKMADHLAAVTPAVAMPCERGRSIPGPCLRRLSR